LESNYLTGEVPIINSTSLAIVSLEQNALTGTVPEQICSIPFVEITADCGEIFCDCCLECSNSTSNGNPAVTINTTLPTDDTTSVVKPDSTFFDPVSNPTNAPETCNSITTGTDCYTKGMIIDLMINNCDAQEFDRIGMYPDVPGVDIDLPDAIFWVMSCGSDHSCSGVLADGSIYLENRPPEQLGFAPWPLDEGSYRLHLIRVAATGLVTPLAASDSFRIADNKC
jgi:hypothetical protein